MADPVIGAFVFPDVWADLDGFRALLAGFRECGVTAVVTESDTYDERAIDATRELGLKFYAGIACFSDHASNFSQLAARPELTPILENGEPRPQMEWYVGITPTDRGHQEAILRSIGTIAGRYDIDGLFLDFVRWPIHWEIELRPGRAAPLDSSFDSGTLKAFTLARGIAPPPDRRSPAQIAARILNRHRDQWIDFKCDVITGFVREARTVLKSARTTAQLGAFLVPDGAFSSEAYTGQRLRDLIPLVDWAAPMLYHGILLQAPEWVGRQLDRVAAVAGEKTLPVLQADSNRDPSLAADWGPPMDVGNWESALAQIVGKPAIAGLIVFPGTSLLETGRGEALGAMVHRG